MARKNSVDDDLSDDNEDDSPYDTLKVLQRDYERNEVGHREGRWLLIQRAAVNCDRLKKDPNDISLFTKDKFWKEKPYQPKPSQLLLLCMQYMLRAPSSTSETYSTAWDYAKAVRILYDDDCRSDRIFEELKVRGGPYGITKRERKDSSDFVHRPIVDEDDTGEQVTDESSDDGSGNLPLVNAPISTRNRGDRRRVPQKQGGATEGKAKKPVRIFNKDEHIAVSPEEYLDDMHDQRIAEQRWYLIERAKDEGKVKRYVVVAVRKKLVR